MTILVRAQFIRIVSVTLGEIQDGIPEPVSRGC
jgi:hypothetical protein